MIGQTVSHYRVLSLLGTGGMGEVYLARDDRLHRDVALKVISHRAMTSDLRARFRREALALSRLNHPNVATIHDVGQDGNVDYLVMEYVDGVPLDEKIRERPLTRAEIYDLGLQLAEGLSAAHQQGLIHRDLKPANIRINRDGRLKILDFGLARLDASAGDQTDAGTELITKGIVGTIPYMAPEQLGGGATDGRTDIYGACAVLYEMATGRRPHHDQHGAALMTAILGTIPDRPRRSRRDLPEDLDALIMKGLEKDPDSRYANGTELAAEFHRLRAGEATRAATDRRRSFRVSRLVPIVLGLSLALLAVIDAGGIRTRILTMTGLGDPPLDSLVVLPLQDLSPQRHPELNLAAPLTNALTARLQGISGLSRVISPRTARQFEGSSLDPSEIASRLGVDAIVDASFQVIDDEIQVQIALIRARDGSTVWAGSYQRDLRDLLMLQNQLASMVAEKIGVALHPDEVAELSRNAEVDPLAVQDYERALALMSTGMNTNMAEAATLLSTVVRIAPDWADAHARLALACAWTWGFDGERRDLIEVGKRALSTSMQLDAALAVNHTARAAQEFWFNFDLAAAKSAHQRARELDPADPTLAIEDAVFWCFAGEPERAIARGIAAFALDPLSPTTSRILGWIYWDTGHYEEALSQHEITRELLATYPDAAEARYTEDQTAWNLIALGRLDDLEAGGYSVAPFDSCYIQLTQGDTLGVRQALERPYWEQSPWHRDWKIYLEARLGNTGPLFESIETYYRDRNPRIWWVMNETLWSDPVLDDPRWREWRQLLGLPT